MFSMFIQLCTHPDASQQQGVHFAAILSNRHRSYNRYGRLLLRAQIDRHFPASFFSFGGAGQVCGGVLVTGRGGVQQGVE